jgi:methylosome protein 50
MNEAVRRLISFCSIDGYMLLGCSNLTGRFWTGSLWYFLDPDSAPDVEKCLTGIECETGITDGKFLEDNNKVDWKCG